MEVALRERGCVPQRGSDFDPWDLEVSCGVFGSARLAVAAEPHGSGLQLLRIVCRPRCSFFALGLAIALSAVGSAAGLDGIWSIYGLLCGAALWILARTVQECGAATAGFLAVVRKIQRIEKKELPNSVNPKK
jgi:hypothetical protein